MDSQRLLVLLLLLLLGVSGPQGQEPTTRGPSEEPSEEEISEEDGVLVLNRHTLGLALSEHPALLVEFCECAGSAGWGWGWGGPCRGYPVGSNPHPEDLGAYALEGPSWGSIGGHLR